MIVQSLFSVIRKELDGYINLVSALEGEIRSENDNFEVQGVHMHRVTFRKCLVWMQDAILALRLISSLLDDIKGMYIYIYIYIYLFSHLFRK